MKNVLFILCAFVFALGANAVERPKAQLGGGIILGDARLVGENRKVSIVTCDKSKKICLYVLKKVTAEPEDNCDVAEMWKVPPIAEQQFDANYPFAFSFDTEVLTFYPATAIIIGCRDEEGNVQVSIETEAQIRLP